MEWDGLVADFLFQQLIKRSLKFSSGLCLALEPKASDSDVRGLSKIRHVQFILTYAILFWFGSSVCNAQSPNLHFRHITTSDGLSQGVVNQIFKDSHGFIWMSTYDGINRFDGSELRSNNEIAPGLGIISNSTGIIEDSKGNVWLGSVEALIKFDYHQNRFFRYTANSGSQQMDNKIRDAYYPFAERNGYIICSTSSYPRCYIFDSVHETFSPFFVKPNERTGAIDPGRITIKEGQFADLYAFAWWNDKGPVVSWMEQKNDSTWTWRSKNLPEDYGSPFVIIRSGDLIDLVLKASKPSASGEQFDHSTFCTYNIKTDSFRLVYFANYSAYMGTRYKGKVYLCSEKSGIHIIDEQSQKETGQISHDPDRPNGIMSNNVAAFSIINNQLWVSSWGEGADYAVMEDALFASHFPGHEATHQKASNFIRGIVEDVEGNFWCNTLLSGIVQLNHNLEYIATVKGTETINSASIFLDGDQNLYFGDKGLFAYNLRNKILKRISNVDVRGNRSIVNNDFHYFTNTRYGELLTASMNGAFKIDSKHQQMTTMCPGNVDLEQLQQFIYSDSIGHLYVNTAKNGLIVLQKKGDGYEQIYQFDGRFITRHAYEQNDSTLWLGTTAGLLQFDTKRLNVIRSYTTSDGLPNNTVYAIAADDFGKLWLSTNKGLSAFEIETCTFKNYLDDPGQQGMEYNRHAVCKARDGRILFGGVEGITEVRPWLLHVSVDTPLVQFTSVKSGEYLNPFRYDQPSDRKVLGAGSALIEFHFVAIDYVNSKRCKLTYKMNGIDPEWRESSNPGSAMYVNLKPGQYSFIVRASDSNGVWSKEGKTFYFEIAAFWWQTIWFKVLAFFSFILIMFVWIRLWLAHRWNQQKNQLEKQLAILKEHERISADLHDDIGSTLSSISVYSELADKYYETRPEKSHEIVHKISVQTRELMVRIEDIIWSLKPNVQDKSTFKTRLHSFAIELLSARNIAHTIAVDDGIEDLLTNPVLRKNILLIFKEAVNNCSKYSEASTVDISMKAEAEQLIFQISDNGNGFNQAQSRIGNGLRNMEKRSQDMGGNFSLESISGKGTSIRVIIPIATIRHLS